MTQPVLSVDQLTVSYTEEPVLRGVSLEAARGEVLCVAGESGSGKSTLLGAICGTGKQRIQSGTITFRGTELVSMKPGRRRELMGNGIGWIPQNPAGSFNPIRKLYPQFRETLKSHHLPCDKDKIMTLLSRFGLQDPERILESRPYVLSGGMNQRIAIAFSMLLTPSLLLCDEVTSALDVTTAITVIDALRSLKKEKEVTMLFVTHHLGIAREIADRIAILHRGEIVETGPTARVLTQPAHDYTRKLLRDVPRLSEERDDRTGTEASAHG